MESASIINFLIDIVDTRDICHSGKLASMYILNKIFLKESGTDLQLKCLNTELTSSLVTMIDSGLNGLDDPTQTVCISVAMEILSQFSKLPVSSIQGLITESVIERLLGYINTSSSFYQFPNNAKKELTEMCEGKQFLGKVKMVSMATEPLDYIHRHTKHTLRRVPEKIKLCRLVDTHYDDDLDICQHLVNKQLAWPGSFPGEVVSESDDWENIIVTQVLDGCMFWGQVGEKTIKSVFDIQRQLNESVEHVQISNVHVGDTVVVYGKIMGNPCYLRAQVLSHDVGHVEVFAIDYGYTLKVLDRNVYKLPESLNTKNVKRKISLCSLDGVTPPPYDDSLTFNAAAILLNLCKQSLPAGEILVKLDGIQMIKNFIQECPKPKLTAQVVTILLNLSAYYSMAPAVVSAWFITLLLDTISSYTERGPGQGGEEEGVYVQHASNDEKLLMARCVMCLSNIICRNTDTKSQFYKQQGVDKINALMIQVDRDDPVYYFCVKLLRVYLGKFKIKSTPELADLPTIEDLQSPQTENAVFRRTCGTNKKSQDDLFKDDFDSDSDPESQNVHGVEGSNTHVVQPSDRSQGYYLGERLNLYDDEQHELCPQKNVTRIQVLSFAKHVCGMLNTGYGGTIYFGVDENSEVFGLELTRDEKDRFRLGVDQHMFSKISPALLHSQFSIKDIPVIDPNTGQTVPNHFVIEIKVRGSKGSIYTMIDGACYYRFGSDTSKISRQELRQLIVLEDETTYTEITKLLSEKQRLIQELQLSNT